METEKSTWALAPAGCFPVPRALAIARGVAQGLAAAHAKGIVHRDVKPENILLANPNTSAETPKLLDFGIAAVHETVTAVSRTRGLLLTPPYASPEQWRGLPSDQLDGRADLYALGGVLYEMLTGQTPFHAHNTEGWMYQHLHEQPQPPSQLRPELANWQGLDDLVLSVLAKDRDQRPRDAADFTTQLDDVYYGPPRPRSQTVVYESSSVPIQAQAAPEPVPSIRYEEPERPRRFTRFLGAAGAAVVIAAAVGFWILASRSPQTEAPAAQAPFQDPGPTNPQPQQTATPEAQSAPAPDFPATEQKAEALFKQKNYSKARPLFQAACNGNELKACSYLGYLYSEGLGGPKSLQTAREVYRKACEGGPQSSCYSLASLYVDAGDKAEARIYFQKACDAKVADSCDLLNSLQ